MVDTAARLVCQAPTRYPPSRGVALVAITTQNKIQDCYNLPQRDQLHFSFLFFLPVCACMRACVCACVRACVLLLLLLLLFVCVCVYAGGGGGDVS